MKNDPELLDSAKAGFANPASLALAYFSSPIWCAHRAGATLARNGGDEPVKVAMSRGFNVRVETALGHQFIVHIRGKNLEHADLVRA